MSVLREYKATIFGETYFDGISQGATLYECNVTEVDLSLSLLPPDRQRIYLESGYSPALTWEKLPISWDADRNSLRYVKVFL